MAAYNRNSFYYLCVNEENNDCSSKLKKKEKKGVIVLSQHCEQRKCTILVQPLTDDSSFLEWIKTTVSTLLLQTNVLSLSRVSYVTQALMELKMLLTRQLNVEITGRPLPKTDSFFSISIICNFLIITHL